MRKRRFRVLSVIDNIWTPHPSLAFLIRLSVIAFLYSPGKKKKCFCVGAFALCSGIHIEYSWWWLAQTCIHGVCAALGVMFSFWKPKICFTLFSSIWEQSCMALVVHFFLFFSFLFILLSTQACMDMDTKTTKKEKLEKKEKTNKQKKKKDEQCWGCICWREWCGHGCPVAYIYIRSFGFGVFCWCSFLFFSFLFLMINGNELLTVS